jgi:Kef-type K+ transport system membrane component KefB
MERIVVLIVITFLVYFLVELVPAPMVSGAETSILSFGFLLLASYLFAQVLARFHLPRITGYIIAGMLLGPSISGILSAQVIEELTLVDDLALTFIAFAAGGELRMSMLRERSRSIAFTLIVQVLVVLVGVSLTILALGSVLPLTAGKSIATTGAVALICGAIAVARSPSSAIAIISETKARGPFTEMVLGVTVAADVLTIFLFAVVLPLAEVLTTAGAKMDLSFLFGLTSEVAASVLFGVIVGRGIDAYLEKVREDMTIFVLGLAFLITRVAASFATWLDSELNVSFHLEPMLICITAGFFVQNRSQNGETFLQVIDRSSMPIYAIFFSLSGAALKLEALEETWQLALLLVALRGIFMYAGAYLGGKLAADPVKFQRASGLGFLTQAGVSLGLVKIIADRVEGIGPGLATLLVATVAINQLIGPVAFKQALSYVGESHAAQRR